MCINFGELEVRPVIILICLVGVIILKDPFDPLMFSVDILMYHVD